MITLLLFLAWLFLLIYGVVLLRASKYRKFGIMLTTLLLAPVAVIVFLVWYIDYEYISCMLNGSSETMEYCNTL